MNERNPFSRRKPLQYKVHQCVTLDTELKTAMSVYRDQINWSAVANAAWESVLKDIAASKKTNDYERVLDGLGKTLKRFEA